MPAPQVESLFRPTRKASTAAGPANISPQPPGSPEIGEQLAQRDTDNAPNSRPNVAADGPILRHEALPGGELSLPPQQDDGNELDELLTRAIRNSKRGRPAAFDEHAKGKLVALLALGLSLRQAASLIGVHHTTITNTLNKDAALTEEIKAARFQAQVQPLACVVRESRRSWKAATWLLKYLDSKIAAHEETPDERTARRKVERAAFFAEK